MSGTVANTEGVTAPAAVTLTIADDESASTKVTLAVSPTSVAEDATGSDRTVTVTAALDGDPLPEATVVWIAVQSDSAVAGTDYTAVPSFKVTIDEGQTSGSGTFTLAPIDDNVVETDETVTVRGTVVSGLPVESATVMIEDNDDPAVTLVLDPDVISENEGVSTVTATLDRSSTAETTITVSASAVDPATASDFTLSSDKTLTIAAGATTSTGTVTISAVNNDDDDDRRQVTVSGTVANTDGVTAPVDMTLTILDDESASTKVTLTVSPTSVREDAARAYDHGAAETTVTVTAELDEDVLLQETEVTVSVSGDSAIAGTDYTAVQSFTITIAPGDTSGTGTLTLAPIDDLLDEPDETVTVTGTTTSGLSVEPATIKIEDNDYAPTVNGDGSETLWEATLTTAATTNLAPGPGYYHSLNQGALTSNSFTYAGTTFAMDFFGIEPGSGSCAGPNDTALKLISLRGGTWGSSEASWVLHVGSHTFDFANAGERSGAAVAWCGVTAADLGWAGGDTVAVKIVRPPTRATLVLDPDVISESGGVSTVTATLNQTSTAETTITVSASAVPPAAASDFTLSSDTTLTIAARATTSTGTVTISAVNNDDKHDSSQVTVSGTVANTEGVTGPADVILAVADDDSASTKVTLSVSPTSVAEDATGSDRTVTVTAELDGDPLAQATAVWVAVQGDSAVVGTDFVRLPGFAVTIDAGKTSGSGTFILDPIDDNLVETDETVTVRGTVVSGLPVESATVTIEDNDDLMATLVLDSNHISEDGGFSTVTATLNGLSTAETTVTVSAAAVSPAMDSAFTLSSDQTLTIAAGQRTSTGTVTITAVNNTADDDNREVTVSGTVVNADGVLAPEDVTLTIFDDESVSTKVTLTVSPTSVAEDATGSDRRVTVTAALDGDPLPQATRVRVSMWKANGGTATPTRDYTPVSSFTVTIKEGETSGTGTFTLAPVDDDIDEPDETVVLTGRNTTSDLPVEPVSGVTVTIEDNDPTAVRLVLTQRSIGEYGGLTTVIATLGRALTEEVSLAVSATAVDPATASDFTLSPDTVLTIAPGKKTSTGTVTITANNNDVAADDKSVTVSGVTTSVEDVTQPRDLTLTIVDDDARGMSYVPSTGVQSTATWWEPQSSEGRGTLKSRDVAQSFRTGPCEDGYHLAIVSIKFRTPSNGSNDRLMLTLHRSGLEGTPAESIGLNGTLSHASGRVGSKTMEDGTPMTYSMFGPPANNPRLEPNRTYFFKLHDPHMSGVDEPVSTASVSFTANDREARTMHEHGWSIGDESFIAARSTSGWSKIGHSVRMFIGFNAVDRSCKGKRSTGGGGSEANGLPELSVINASATESGDGTTRAMTFAVSVEPAPSETVTVSYETEDGTATGGEACPATPGDGGLDYVSTSGTLTFGPEEATTKDVEVTVCDDAVEDTGEEFSLVLRSTQLMEVGEETLEVRGTGVIWNVESTTEVSLFADAAYAEEGAEAVFRLMRAGDAEQALTVPVSVAEDGAVLATPVPASVTFAPWARKAELRVATDDDGADEPDSTVTATVAAGFAWQVADGAATAAVTVLDNDAAPVADATVSGVTIWSADMTVVEYGPRSIGAGSAELFANQAGRDGLGAKWLWYDPGARKLKLAFDDGLEDAESLTLHVGDVSVGFPEHSAGDSSFTLEGVDISWTDGETVAVRVSKPSAEAVSTDATLASLTVEGALLSPAFDAGVAVYRAAVDAGVETVTVAATATDGGATVVYGPAEDADAELADHQVAVAEGETLVEVTVTAADWKTERSYRVVMVRAAANKAPAGLPIITGTPGVGEALTASADAVTDADGVVTATYAWQWLANGGTQDTDIEGATGETYRLTAAELGKTLKVRVTFTDDKGTEETLVSTATEAVAATVPSAPVGLAVATPEGRERELALSWSAPPSDGGSEVTGYRVQWKSGTEAYDGSQTSTRQAVLSDAAATSHVIAGLVNGTVYTVRVQAVNAVGDGAAAEVEATVEDRVAPTLTGAVVDGAVLTLTYGEALDEESAPAAGAFTVTAAGAARTVDEVSLSGSAVVLTLASAVVVDETVTVGYTVPTGAEAAPLKDAAGNASAGFTGEAVVNATASVSVLTVTLSVADAAAQPGRIQVRIAFAEAVTGLALADVMAARVGGDTAAVSELVETETGRVWTAWVAAADAGRYTVRLAAGAARSGERQSLAAVLAVDVDAAGNADAVSGPVVTSIALAMAPDGGWTDGDAVRLALTFSEPVTVVTDGGTPSVGVGLDGSARQASYASGTGTASLAFSYTVTADDGTVSAVTVTADSLALNGGTIRDAGGRDADLGTLAVSFTVAAGEAVDPDALTASFEGVPDAHDGSSPFTFRVRFNLEPRVSYTVLRDESFAVTGGEVRKARRVDGRNDLREIHIEPEGWDDVAVMLAGGRACGTRGAICTADNKVLANTATAVVPGPLALSVADANATEGTDPTLDFAVSLSRAASATVTVDYASADGTATAGADYTAASGTLTFRAGETEKKVNVAVLDDAHDDGGETLTLTLSNASGARLRDAEATGTIENSDPIPKAWLARFGRTVAGQVVDAISGRMEGSPEGGSHVTVGGQRLSFDGDGGAGAGAGGAAARDALAALAGRIGGSAEGGTLSRWEEDEPGDGWMRERGEDGTRSMTGRDLLLGSSFRLALGGDSKGDGETAWTAWGGASSSHFDGEAEGLSLDGEVTTFTLGADLARERWLAGVAVSLSDGEGGFRDHVPVPGDADHPNRGSGELASTLTGIHPYASLDVSERLTLWGVLGYGTGELKLAVDGGERWTTDTAMRMAAAGGRGVLVPGGGDGIELAVRTDGQLVRMTSEAATGTAGGNLAATAADTSRVRAMLEGSRRFALEGGGTLTPSLEAGLRHDGGDAETGAGIELGGGLRYTDPATGLTVDAKARGLVAHEDADYAEWGASGSVRIAPHASGRGLSLRIAPAWGATSGGAERLWSAGDARGLGARDDAFEPRSRLEAEVGYGFSVFGGRGVATPQAAWSRAERSATLRLGQRLKLGVSEWHLESELAEENRTFRAGYGYRPGNALDLSLEASRREAANDDAPEHEITLRARLRW